MISIQKIMGALERIAPFSLKVQGDNVGLLVDCGEAIDSILLCLDVTPGVISEAVSRGASLIISHHPVIYHPIKVIQKDMPVYLLCKNNISCIAMHTNLDIADGGVNDRLAELFGIEKPEYFNDMGRIGRLKKPVLANELAQKAASMLSCYPKVYDSRKPVETLAVLGGSGSVVQEAFDAGADCLLTGEARYDQGLLAQQLGISLIQAGHFATEWPVVEVLFERLSRMFLRDEAEFFVSAVISDPMDTIFE